MKNIISLSFILLIAAITNVQASTLKSCENDAYLVVVSAHKMTDQEDIDEALHLLQSPNLIVKAQTTLASGKVIALVSMKNSSAEKTLVSLINIPGVLVECETFSHTNPRMTGTN